MIRQICCVLFLMPALVACNGADDRNGGIPESNAVVQPRPLTETPPPTTGPDVSLAPPVDTDLPPSGEVQDRVRVITIKARLYEFIPDTIVVNEGDLVRLQITSEDVEHGFAIWSYGIDYALPPGQTVSIEFFANRTGRHFFHCSVYCGPGHVKMRGVMFVKPIQQEQVSDGTH